MERYGSNKKPRILLVEDNEIILKSYFRSLEESGFSVVGISDADNIENLFWEMKFNIILCDTDNDIGSLDGPDACRNALDKKLISEDVLVIGMSDDSRTNQPRWAGIAHHAGFYDKDYSDDNSKDKRKGIGFKVMAHYLNFEKAKPGTSWRARMLPKVEY